MKISCIIPFYNEEKRIEETLRVIEQVKGLTAIYCVDDGSTDMSADIVKQCSHVQLIQLLKNKGKTRAVKEGLKHVKTEYVFLLDADLHNLQSNELTATLQKITTEIDMLVLRRIHEGILVRLLRMDTVLSGQRILKTKDLQKILSKQVSGYNIEVAMNEYMMENKKTVYWTATTATNSFRAKKWGVRHSMKTNISMFKGFFKEPGFFPFLKQLAKFCREELPSK